MAKRKSKRLFPKRFASDFINTYKGADQSKIEAFDIFKNRQRVSSTVGPSSNALPKLNNSWTRNIPETKHLSTRHIDETGKEHYIPTPRLLALHSKLQERLTQDGVEFWQGSLRYQGFEYGYHRIVLRTDTYDVLHYMCGNKGVIIKHFKEENRIIYSRVYGRQEALDKFEKGKVYWAGEKSVTKM